MDPLVRLVTYLVIALIAFSGVIVIALILVEGFSEIAPTLVAAVLGPLTTAISVLGGFLASRGIEKAKDEEKKLGNGEA